MPLLDAKGNHIPPTSNYTKAKPPIKGEAFAPRWAGDLDRDIFKMPGGGTVLFDLSRLTLADFRTMRDHYQVNATLSVLTFMLHQMDWRIECDNPKIKQMVTDNVTEIWTQLIRAISQAFWAGYSPNVLQYENIGKYLQITKIKDLIPEQCAVEWDDVPGWAPEGHIPPKIRVFNGIKVWGQNWPVPTQNSFWYPLLMENGDYYGKKLLRPVFTSWYFSILMHLFANRYFERFGEPVPVGRASYEDEITVPTSGGPQKVNGADLMVSILQNLRNRSVVVLPNDRSPTGVGTGTEFDYNIEYLESQMRGADFERYLMRLDEEISLGLFTPLLILRTADVGSYSLGETHWNMYINMLHAISGDAKYFIDNFILSRLVDSNFGVNAPRARIVFRRSGDDRKDAVMAILQALMSKGTVKPDLVELGNIVGLKLEEVELLTDTAPGGGPGAQPGAQGSPSQKEQTKTGGEASKKPAATKKKAAKNSKAVLSEVAGRISSQVNRWVASDRSEAFIPDFGYNRKLSDAMELDGAREANAAVDELYRLSAAWMADLPAEVLVDTPPMTLLSMIESVMTNLMQDIIDA